MKLTRYLSLFLGLLMAAVAMQGLASPGSPKMPSTLNFQSLNELSVPSTDTEWAFELSKLDMCIASDHLAGLRSRNTDMYLLKYMLLHTVLINDTPELNALASYAAANGYDVETAFLHYYDDTSVTYSGGKTETIKGYGGGTAATLKDARVKGYIWLSDRYLYDLKSPLFQRFKGSYYRNIITSSPYPDGIFIDETSPTASYFPTINSGGRVVEYGNQTPSQFSSAYMTDMTAAFAQVNALMGSDHPTCPGGERLLLPNIAEYVLPFMDLGINGADGLLTEFWMQVLQPRVTDACDWAKQLADKGKILIFTQGTAAPEIPDKGNYTSAMDRHQMFSLSNYWLAKQGRYTYYQQKAPDGGPSLSQFWCKAREFDVGAPVDPIYSIWKTGTDPAGQNYTIYKRTYTKGLILSRPKIGWTYSDYGTLSQAYDLGGSYRLLHSDATLGPDITKIGLAMGEAVTLVRSDGGVPTDTTPPTISSVTAAGMTGSGATITWSTNESSTGSVDYGATTSYGSSAPASTASGSQSVTLSGLTANTTYHFRVSATDAAGNTAQSADYTFTTTSSGGGETGTPSFIKHWALIGPFGQGHNIDFIGEATNHPSVGDATAGKTWTDFTSPTDKIDLYSVVLPNTYSTAYLNTYVYSPAQRNCQLRIGVDDAAKAFVNGAQVLDDPGYRSPNPDTNKADIVLNAGWNQLLIKAENFTVGWTLYARITDAQGNNLSDLNYQVNYPNAPAGGTPNIAVTISVDKQIAKVGEKLVYTVAYTNTGSGSASSAIVSADVNPYVTFVSATGGGAYDATAKVVRWSLGTLAPGMSGSVTYTVTVN